MATELAEYVFKQAPVRVYTDGDGNPWFVAKDVCAAVGLSKYRDAIAKLDDDERGSTTLDTPGGRQTMATVNEAGLYSLIMRSTSPIVKPFKRWVTHEVLPAIRAHGGYLTPAKVEEALLDPDTLIKLATQLKKERERRAVLEAQAEADRPKVLFADAVATSKSTCLVGELAKILAQNGVKIGQNRLFQWLRDNGFLISRKSSDWNMPKQWAIERGLFEIKETAITHADGHVTVNRTPKVTGAGQQYFVARFLNAAAGEGAV